MVGGDSWIIANWKSHKTVPEALEWVRRVGEKIDVRKNVKVVVCPQFEAIPEVKKEIMVGNLPLLVGAQDISPFPMGAYTGEESASSLKLFITLCIIGHSERRRYFGESDQLVADKVRMAREEGIIPLVCIQGEETPVPEGCELVAYEPVFAIGTGNPDTPENAQQVAQKLKEKYGEKLQVLYGGSVTKENVVSFITQPDISGVLIGGASLDPDEFCEIVRKVHEAYS